MALTVNQRVALRAMVALVLTAAGFGALVLISADYAYFWVKAFHVIAIISWMAGMLYLPRLFVNHAGLAVGSPESELLKGMEGRLLRIIVNPAMILSWVLGLWLGWAGGHFTFEWAWLAGPWTWFHWKVVLVLLLSWHHGFLSLSERRFREDRNPYSGRFWRIMNEVPALLMIGIVILVVVKPF